MKHCADPQLAELSVKIRRQIGMLTQSALDQLWHTSPDALPDDPEYLGCCPVCCAPCATLSELMESGDLEEWVQGWPQRLDSIAWWDSTNHRVDRAWLARSWSNTDRIGCAEYHGQRDQDIDETVTEPVGSSLATCDSAPVPAT